MDRTSKVLQNVKPDGILFSSDIRGDDATERMHSLINEFIKFVVASVGEEFLEQSEDYRIIIIPLNRVHSDDVWTQFCGAQMGA